MSNSLNSMPFPYGSTRDEDDNRFWLDRELSLIQAALEDRGEDEARRPR